MDWFLCTLLAPIGKDFTSHLPQTEEVALQIALKYDLIYAQSGYVYTVLPDPDPVALTHRGHLMPPMVLLELSLIHPLNLP